MKVKLKYSFLFIIVFIVIIGSVNLLEPSKTDKVKGKIHILVRNEMYDYVSQCADNFMKDNDKVVVQVDKLNSFNDVKGKLDISDSNTVQIFEMDYPSFKENKMDDFDYYDLKGETLKGYSTNFSESTLKKYSNIFNKAALPFTSRPLALYVKTDVLTTYGYSKDDFNTWDDVINAGSDIYNKSAGKVKLLSGSGEDYNDLLNLLIMQSMNHNKSVEELENTVNENMQKLKDENIITNSKNEEFIIKISSIDGINDIIKSDNSHIWNIVNVPSESFGKSKFFSMDDTQLYILKNTNNELADKFIKTILTEENISIDYMHKGNFFLSYLYYYKNKKIEQNIPNMQGQAPLVVLSNVEIKSQYIGDYDKYLEIRKDLG